MSVWRRCSSFPQLFKVKYHFFFAGQFFLDLAGDQIQVFGVRHVIQGIGGNGEHRAEAEVGDPFLIQLVKLPQVFGGDGAFKITAALGDAPLQCGDRGAQVHDQVGRGQELGQHAVQLAVAQVITFIHQPTAIKVVGENFGVLVHAAVLNGRAGVVDQLAVSAQAAGEEEYLRVERPGAHILVKIGQVGVIGHRLVEWLPTQAVTQQGYQRGFAHADIAGHSNKFFHTTSQDSAVTSSATAWLLSSSMINSRRALGRKSFTSIRRRQRSRCAWPGRKSASRLGVW